MYDTLGLAPHGPDIFGKAVRARIKNKIEGALFKTGQVGHIALNSLELKTIAISHYSILE